MTKTMEELRAQSLNFYAKKRGLRADLTANEVIEILKVFDNKCALTGRTGAIHFDHFIPLATQKGGTYKGNLIILDRMINISKNNFNPFEWIKNKSISKERFLYVVSYLADLNSMTTKEYEEYVYYCFRERPKKEKLITEKTERLTTLNLFSTKEIRDKFKLSNNDLAKMRKEGLPHKRMGRKIIRYDMEKVSKWLEEKD